MAQTLPQELRDKVVGAIGGGLSCHAASISALHAASSSPVALLDRPSNGRPAVASVSPSVSEQIYSLCRLIRLGRYQKNLAGRSANPPIFV